MFRVKKVLNHNAVLALGTVDNKEFLLIGKGIGFGRKVSEYMDVREEDTVYSLQQYGERGSAESIVKSVSPICFELANEVLGRAEKAFGKIDRSILFSMADHLEYAIKRIRSSEQISNPLTEDIRVLFHQEYKVAECIGPLMKEALSIDIDEHEIGYIALHIHSAIEDENVSQAMQVARAVRECIILVEQKTGKTIDAVSFAYNRLMNHVRYMVARALTGEQLKLNMNDYMEARFPEAFRTAAVICETIGHSLHCKLEEVEIGYLAMHIERVTSDELQSKSL